jgi:hypothetical protein
MSILLILLSPVPGCYRPDKDPLSSQVYIQLPQTFKGVASARTSRCSRLSCRVVHPDCCASPPPADPSQRQAPTCTPCSLTCASSVLSLLHAIEGVAAISSTCPNSYANALHSWRNGTAPALPATIASARPPPHAACNCCACMPCTYRCSCASHVCWCACKWGPRHMLVDTPHARFACLARGDCYTRGDRICMRPLPTPTNVTTWKHFYNIRLKHVKHLQTYVCNICV